MKSLERLLKALSDGTRLRILNILLCRETCACDLQRLLGLPQPLLSRHLAYLRNAGIVADRRDGPRVWYSLTLQDKIGQNVKLFLKNALPQFEIFPADLERMRESDKEMVESHAN